MNNFNGNILKPIEGNCNKFCFGCLVIIKIIVKFKFKLFAICSFFMCLIAEYVLRVASPLCKYMEIMLAYIFHRSSRVLSFHFLVLLNSIINKKFA